MHCVHAEVGAYVKISCIALQNCLASGSAPHLDSSAKHAFTVQVLNEEDSRLKVNISAGQNPGFQMKTHPNIDKALYSSQSVLGLKDPQKPFPAGSPLGILKWRMQVSTAHTG